MMFTKAVAFSLITLQCGVTVFGSEPVCSRFHYEEQLLEKMIHQEIAFEKMKSEMEGMKQTFAMDLEKKNVAFEQMERKLESTINDIKASNDEHIKAYSEEMETFKASIVTPLVAFKAHKATDKTVSNNKIIVFTENLLNLGDAYNNKTGIFVAPVAGLYMFTVQICFPRNNWMIFGIFKQNKEVSSKVVGDKVWEGCSTFDSVTMLDQGEEVTVRCSSSCEGSDRLWEYTSAVKTNSFSGVLLHKVTI